MAANPATLKLEESSEITAKGTSYERTYEVFTTSPNDGEDVVRSAAGLPMLFDPYPSDALSRVTSIRPEKQSDSLTHWLVRVRYDIGAGSGQQEDQQKPPTLRPVRISTGTKWVEKALMRDNTRNATFPDGQPLLTAAKTPFNPPVTVQVPNPTFSFTRWENATGTPRFTFDIKKNFEGRINSADWGPFLQREVLCTSINGTMEWEQDAQGVLRRYWIVTYEFEYHLEGFWNPMKILNADYWFIDPADSKRKPIYVDADGTYGGPDLANGVPVPSPVPLSSDGAVLQASDLPDSVNYLDFNVFKTADFNELGLPINA